MSTAAIGSSLNNLLSTNGNGSSTNRTASLGSDQFLQLLLAQIQNQNPLDPLSDSDFTAQLAQFSQLESLQQLNTAFAQQLQLQGLAQGANLIGRTITYTQSGTTTPGVGTVSAVQVNDGQVQLQVGSTAVALSQVLGVTA